MATIGHTLVGLSAGGACPRRLLTPRAAAIWLGVTVLAAHLIDVVEWLLTVVAPGHFSQHAVTHSPLLVVSVLVGSLVLSAIGLRSRHPLPYVLISAAILSHLVMDFVPFRKWLLVVYGHETGSASNPMPLRAAIEAEVWAYGLLLVLVALHQASRQPGCPPLGRRAAIVLAILSIAAAITRTPLIWIPAYGLALVHAIVLLRRHLTPSLAWGLVPLVPLFALMATEAVSYRLFKEACALQKQGQYDSAISLHRRALGLPTRSAKDSIYVYLSFCYLDRGELEACFQALQKAIEIAEVPVFARMSLARFYVSGKTRGTQFDRPDEAALIFREALANNYPPEEQASARENLARIEQRRGAVDRAATPKTSGKGPGG